MSDGQGESRDNLTGRGIFKPDGSKWLIPMIDKTILNKLVGRLVMVFTNEKISKWKGWLSRESNEKAIKLTSRKNELKSESCCYVDMDKVIAIKEIPVCRPNLAKSQSASG